MAQLAFGVAGAVVGNMLLPGIGGSIGFMVGSMVGGALFPTTSYGPKLSDLHIQGSSYGAPIAIEWGAARLAGNVVWKTDLTPHEHESGGKGGPQVVSTSYSASFDIVICESRGDHNLGRVWINGQLKGDYRDGATTVGDLPLVFYDGADDQLPDPTEEGIIGAGLVPAYRGVARVVLTDLDLSAYGNAIPQFNFEILTGIPPDCPVESFFRGDTTLDWHVGIPSGSYAGYPKIVNWPNAESEPDLAPLPASTVFSHTNSFGPNHWSYGSYTGPVHIIDGIAGQVWVSGNTDIQSGRDHDFAVGWGEAPFVSIDIGTCAGGRSGDVHQWNLTAGDRKQWVRAPGSTYPIDREAGGTTPFLTCVPMPLLGLNIGQNAGIDNDLYVHATTGSPDGRYLFVFTGNAPYAGGANTSEWWRLVNGVVDRHGTCIPNLGGPSEFGYGPHTQPQYLDYYVSSAENDGIHIWAYQDTPSSYVRCYKIDDDNNLARICTAVGLTADGAQFRSPAITAFNGYCGVVTYQHWELFWRYDLNAAGVVLLSEIVADICRRDGLDDAQFDVTDIEIPVRGYVLTEVPITGRAALESILPVYSVDAVESDGVIKFIRREGKETVASFDDGDLAAHTDGNELPAPVEVVRAQDAELPMHIMVKYINTGADYLLGAQQTRRMTGASTVQVIANVPVVLSDAEAKRVADIWLFNAWIERERYTWSTTRKYAKYEPTDIVTVGGLDLRITGKTEGADGVIKWEGRKAFVSLYEQAGDASDGAPGAPSDGHVPGEVVPAQASDLVLLDIPYIADPARQAVYWAAMAGHDRPEWRGASLQKSIDAGASYSEIATSTSRSAIGTASGTLGDFDGGNVFDELNRVTVVMAAGSPDLASTTRIGVLNGANRAMLGDELIQYRDAVLTAPLTYLLGGLLRGRNGTEWAIGAHGADETFVALPVDVELASVYAEYEVVRQYKAVTFGRTLATATAQDFTNTGKSLKCFAPVLLGGGRNTAGDILLHWTRRARINNAWIDGIDVPLGEATEKYYIIVYDDATYATPWLGTFLSTTPELTIDASDQTAMAAGLINPLYWSVQQYGALGRGYEARGIT